MTNALVSTNSISFIMVFLEGILSFFSPCVIPLIPVYMSYLAGNNDSESSNGEITYNKNKILLHTLFFVLGISSAFFILGISFTALGSFFNNNKYLFTRIAGVLIIVLGLHQLGLFELNFLQYEKKLNLNIMGKKVNAFVAFLMGFTFSFAWTPCVGPALSSVLILASTASSSIIGNMLVLLYALGFVIPFLVLGIFTTEALNFLKKNQKIIKYTVKAGGVILVLIGTMTYTGWLNNISGYLNQLSSPSTSQNQSEQNTSSNDTNKQPSNNTAPANSSNTDTSAKEQKEEKEPMPAINFTLNDQYGKKHSLSDYKGKVVFLNFWATWCPPCKMEMPDIEALYKEYGLNKEQVVFLGVANPKSATFTNTRETDKKGVIKFLEDNKYTFPVVFDEDGKIYEQYNISALPTTFLIDKNGNIYGYAPGMLSKDVMESAIEQALKSTK